MIYIILIFTKKYVYDFRIVISLNITKELPIIKSQYFFFFFNLYTAINSI